MPEPTQRPKWITRLLLAWFIGVLIFLGLALIATVAKIVAIAMEAPSWFALAPWVLAGVAEIVLVPWVMILANVARRVLGVQASADTSAGRLGRIETLLETLNDSTDRLIDLASLSDRAKSLIHRDREMDAFREIFHEDLLRQDYKTAEALIRGIEEKLGYADEAARMRAELADSRNATIVEKIDAACKRIAGIIDSHDWARATRETHRLVRLFPENPKIAALPEQIIAARTTHKRDLLKAYDEAVRKNDIELGVELLRELDEHLTPQEAAAMAESARGVFRAKLHNLGVQFALHVTDQQWARAVATGEEIIRDFPNTRMSHEVRTKMEQLRQLAAAGTPADQA